MFPCCMMQYDRASNACRLPSGNELVGCHADMAKVGAGFQIAEY